MKCPKCDGEKTVVDMGWHIMKPGDCKRVKLELEEG